MRSSHLTWRHTCVVLDFEEGRVAMWENGRKYFDKTGIADLPATYERNRKEIDIVSAGCVHKAGVTPMMSIHGQVTDFQMWDRILPDEQLVNVTGCKDFPEGNLVNWETSNWYLNSSRGTARQMETMDLESDVCRSRELSLHLVPYKLKFDPEALHMCTKLSGSAAQYTRKPKFDSIVHFLENQNHLGASECLSKVKDEEAWNLKVWVANDDREVEGQFENW